jgi:hypothetical protein
MRGHWRWGAVKDVLKTAIEWTLGLFAFASLGRGVAMLVRLVRLAVASGTLAAFRVHPGGNHGPWHRLHYHKYLLLSAIEAFAMAALTAALWRLVAPRRAATVCLVAGVSAVVAIIEWFYWLID